MNNEQKLMLYLGKNFGKGFTSHSISKSLNIPYATFHRLLNSLRDKGILEFEKVGRAEVVSLNRSNEVILNYLSVASDIERIDYIKKVKIVKKIYDEINISDIVVLFGSYASGEYNDRSDIDILVINSKGDESISFRKYELLFEVKINPIFITKKEFKLMLSEDEENLGKQILKKNIILNNPNEFWRLVYNGF